MRCMRKVAILGRDREDNQQKILSFSEPFLTVYLIEDARGYEIKTKTIVLNLGKHSITVARGRLNPLSSSVYSNLTIQRAEKLVCVELDADLARLSSFPFSNELTHRWQHVHDIFPSAHLKKTRLWRSRKERVGDAEFNLWFAAAGTNCGIHNKHDFNEIHTQIYGWGRIQKFHKNDAKTLCNEVSMGPGYTHEPFYDERGAYPWHQYAADTDCIWLAVEFYGKTEGH